MERRIRGLTTMTVTKCFRHRVDIFSVENDLNEFFKDKAVFSSFCLISTQTFLNKDVYETIVIYQQRIKRPIDNNGWLKNEDGQFVKGL